MSANPANAAVNPLRPGDKLDKYEVLNPIGSGGTSTVWRGYDRLLDRSVAIKHYSREAVGSDQDAFLARFRNEVKIVKQLSPAHKNLVKVIDCIEDPRGLFLVMELVDGPSLEQLLTKNPAPMDHQQVLGIVGATAMALQAIHDQGVLHRDLKPANILLPKAGGLKLTDFGFATMLENQEALTHGTVRYMAPEMFKEGTVDARADIYALGMIAYEMLAGREKFEQAFKVVLRDSRNQTLRWMKWHTSPRATAAPLTQLVPAVPKKMSDLVARMIEKDPAQRIASAEELLTTIRRHFSPRAESEEETRAREEARLAAMAASAAAEPTAAVPKKSKLPVYLAVMAAFWIVTALGLYYYFKVNLPQQQKQKLVTERASDFSKARQSLDAAESQMLREFNKNDHVIPKDARDRFEKDFAGWTKTFADLETAAGANTSEGRSFAAWKNYAEALRLYTLNQPRQAYEQLNQVSLNPDLGPKDPKWLDPERIEERKRDLNTYQTYEGWLTEIRDLIKAGNLGEARKKLNARRNDPNSVLATIYRAQLQELQALIDNAEREQRVQTTLKEARELYDSGKRREARAKIELAIKQPPADQRYKDLLDAWTRDEAIAKERQKLEQAIKQNDWETALASIAVLRGHLPNDEDLKKQQNRLLSEDSYRKGLDALKKHKLDVAAALFQDAVKLDDNPNAQAELDKIKTADARAAHVTLGDSAVAGGRYEEAIRHYDQAIALLPDPKVEEKRKAAKIELALQRATALKDQSKFDEARAAAREAQELDPDNKRTQDLLRFLDLRDAYLARLQAGDKFLREGNYGEAKREYHNALQMMKTNEADERLREAQFQDFFNQARDAARRQEWAHAKTLIESAMNQRSGEFPPEFIELKNQVEQHVAQEKESP